MAASRARDCNDQQYRPGAERASSTRVYVISGFPTLAQRAESHSADELSPRASRGSRATIGSETGRRPIQTRELHRPGLTLRQEQRMGGLFSERIRKIIEVRSRRA